MSERETEEKLRELALAAADDDAARDAALVLIDYYEEHGQPTRAQMWRRVLGLVPGAPSGCSLGIPDLCVEQSPKTSQDPRRNAMIWILHHSMSQRAIAKLFDLSLTRVAQIIADVDRRTRANVLREVKRPTMAATVRLRAAGAIDLSCELGDLPPDDWPLPRRKVRC
jgi:hypothetical protein